jgi:hypothetical protein
MNEKNLYENAVNMLLDIAGNKQFLNSKLQLRLPYDKNAKKIFSSGRIHQDVFWFNVYGIKGPFPEFLKKVIIWTETPNKTGTEKTLINPEYIKLITNKQAICDMIKLNKDAALNDEYKKKLNNIDIKIAELNSALSQTETIKKDGFKYAMMVLKIFFKGYETHPKFWQNELTYEQKIAQILMNIFKNKAEIHYVYVVDDTINQLNNINNTNKPNKITAEEHVKKDGWTQDLEDAWRSKLDDDSVFVPKAIRDIFTEYDSKKTNDNYLIEADIHDEWTEELELTWRDKINNDDFVPHRVLQIFKEHDKKIEYLKLNETKEFVKPQQTPGIIKLLRSENYKIESATHVTNIYITDCFVDGEHQDNIYDLIAEMDGNIIDYDEEETDSDTEEIHAPVVFTDDTIMDFYDSVYIGDNNNDDEYSFYDSCIRVERPEFKTVYVTLLSDAKERELKKEKEEQDRQEQERIEEEEKIREELERDRKRGSEEEKENKEEKEEKENKETQ